MKVACVLITHPVAKAELMRRPELKEKPVAVVDRDVVLDHTPEAAGVRQGMPLTEAMARCPGLITVQADHAHYHALHRQVLRALLERSPLVEDGGPGLAYVGLDGLEALYRYDAHLASALLSAVPVGLRPRVGMARGKFPAYLAALSAEAGRAKSAPRDQGAFVAPFPVDLLPVPPEVRERLHLYGLHTLGQLASLGVGSLQAQFGARGRLMWELARGEDPRPPVPYREPMEVHEGMVLEHPATTLEALMPRVQVLLERAFRRGHAFRAATLRLETANEAWQRHVVFREATSSPSHAAPALRSLLERVGLPGPVEEVCITLRSPAGETGRQMGLFPEARRREQLAESIRQLTERLGLSPIYHVTEVEPWSRIPERRYALVRYVP